MRAHDAAMLPIRTRWIFRSRWIALVWAAGICWMAVQFVGTRKHDEADANTASTDVAAGSVSDADMKKAEDILRKLNR